MRVTRCASEGLAVSATIPTRIIASFCDHCTGTQLVVRHLRWKMSALLQHWLGEASADCMREVSCTATQNFYKNLVCGLRQSPMS